MCQHFNSLSLQTCLIDSHIRYQWINEQKKKFGTGLKISESPKKQFWPLEIVENYCSVPLKGLRKSGSLAVTWWEMNSSLYVNLSCLYPGQQKRKYRAKDTNHHALGEHTFQGYFKLRSHGGRAKSQAEPRRPHLQYCKTRAPDHQTSPEQLHPTAHWSFLTWYKHFQTQARALRHEVEQLFLWVLSQQLWPQCKKYT